MLNVTNNIIFFFIHTLTHYVITRFLRFPEFFLLYAIAILSLVLVRETQKIMTMLFNCTLFEIVLMHILFNLCLF